MLILNIQTCQTAPNTLLHWFLALYDIIKKGYPRHTTLSVSQDTPSIWCSDLLLVTCSKSKMILKGEELKKGCFRQRMNSSKLWILQKLLQ